MQINTQANTQINTKQEYTFRAANNQDIPQVREIVFQVLQAYGLPPDPNGTDEDLQNLESFYIHNTHGKGGTFLLICATNQPEMILGCGGLYPLSDTEAEIRKMYFLPSIRGKGLGSTMLRTLLETAKAKGYTHVSLETASVLQEAIKLYEKFGFKPLNKCHLPSRCDQAYILEL